MKLFLGWLLGCWGAVSLSAAEVSPDARALIERVGKFYDGAKTLQVEIAVANHIENQYMDTTIKSAGTLTVSRPDRVAYTQSGQFGTTLIMDGTSKTVFFPSLKKYTVTEITAPADAEFGAVEQGLIAGTAGARPDIFFKADMTESWLEDAADATLADDETVGGVLCQRLKFANKRKTAVELWIQKDGDPLLVKLVEKMDTTGNKEMPEQARLKMECVNTFTNWRVNEPVPDSAFVFTPPADAQKVDQLFSSSPSAAAPHPLVGQPAPEFTLTDLSGQPVSLSALRGKVVVLDFWATWCPPCVAGLPKIWRVMQEHPDAVFYAVNVKESAADIEKFLAKKKLATLPVLRDADGKISDDYQAKAIPQTVIIGKDGVIVSVHVGLSGDLKAALAKDLAAAAK
ncbi:MAG: DUF2092 domain-containing protein [Verrucomicrobiales bacterium]|jgi:peroxiredoxin|nr:DUF2092 domain-containing protein [Verrucomicrobiales bacterium]